MIREHREGASIVFEQKPSLVAAIIGLCAVILFVLGLSGWLGYRELEQPPWAAVAMALVLTGILVVFFGIERTVFDCERREIRWSKRKLFSRRAGRLAFDEVAGVTLETLGASEAIPVARVVILSETGRLPLTDHYSGSPALWKPILTRIKVIVGLETADSLEDSLRSLVAQGRKIDAVRLLRSERALSLREAKDYVETL